MFYQKKQVESCLICSACSFLFDDPRTLPCGHVFCRACIEDELQNNEALTMICKECKVKHRRVNEIGGSGGGFPVNLILVKLLTLKADHVVQTASYKELRDKLELLNKSADEFRGYLKSGAGEIQKRYSKLKNQIDLEIETRIEELHSLREELKKELNVHKSESIKAYEESTSKQRFCQYLTRIGDFCATTNDYMSQFKIDEKQLSELITQTNQYLDSLKDIDTHLLMNGRKIEFVRNGSKLTRDLVGSFKSQDYSTSLFGLSFFGNDMSVSGIKSIAQLQCSSWEKAPMFYAICFTERQEYELVKIDPADGQIHSRRVLFDKDSNTSIKVSFLSLVITEKNLFVKFNNVSLTEQSITICGTVFTLDPSKKSFVVKLDYNFDPIRFQQCNRFIMKMVANANFVLIHFMHAETLSVFDHELAPYSRTIDAASLVDVAVSDKLLFILDQEPQHMTLRVVDMEKNRLIQRMPTRTSRDTFGQVKVVGDEFVVLRNNNSGLIQVYSQDNYELSKRINFMPGLIMSNDSSNFMTFLDKSKFICLKFEIHFEATLTPNH